ncbi:MAG: ribonuclease H-like domain-containing protein, partial [Romboutsia sp.]|nr:ribonuclease H-like domain-containing protein [Romboutsia sp.]
MDIIKSISEKFIDIPQNHFVFDIETTGLSPKFCKVILIGIVYNENNQTIIKQFFASNEDDDKELLLSFVNEIESFSSHITFNGFTFDIPFLNSRLRKHKINFSLNKDDDIDILRLVKPYKEKLSLLDCKLKTIEKYIGINRDDTISGRESVELYKEFIYTQNKNLKDKILLHNYDDIYYLSQMIKIKDIILDKLNPLIINTNNQALKLIPNSYKINKTNLTMRYDIFDGNLKNINIYEDSYSILSDNKNIIISININKGHDSNNNEILFYKLST